MAGYVSTPNRDASASRAPLTVGRGGLGGTVAVPSRQSDAPVPGLGPVDGRGGQIPAYRPGIDRSNPAPVYSGVDGWTAIHHVRKWVSGVASVDRFVTMVSGALAWTENAVTGSSSTGTSFAIGSRFDSGNYAPTFDTRIQADYVNYQAVQRGQFLDRASGLHAADEVMTAGYFNRLTNWTAYAPYGAQTQVVGA